MRQTAFEVLYREYYVRVFGLCRRLLNSTDQAEDATQEVFTRAYRQFKKYDTKRPFWQWIAAIANNHCIDLLRQRTRSSALFGDEQNEIDQLEGDEELMLDQLISYEHADVLNQAISNLSDKYRVPLVLACLNESSYDEIAGQLNISRNHVGVLILRAKKQLRKALLHAQVHA